jgi:hypothetical protein
VVLALTRRWPPAWTRSGWPPCGRCCCSCWPASWPGGRRRPTPQPECGHRGRGRRVGGSRHGGPERAGPAVAAGGAHGADDSNLTRFTMDVGEVALGRDRVEVTQARRRAARTWPAIVRLRPAPRSGRRALRPLG